MADMLVGPVIDRVFRYAEDQFRWQKGMKEELRRLRENKHMILAVVDFASSQEQIRDQNPLNKWFWQLRDTIDEADDILEEIEYMKQLSRNMSFLHRTAYKLRRIGKRALKIDPNLKRLEGVVLKFDEVSAGVATFFHLAKDAKPEHQEQQLELYRARETGSLPTNDQIGRGKEKEFVMEWLRKPSNERQATMHSNISLLSIVGQGGMGKTTLLQHVYHDEMTKEFDLKIWVCVSNNFNVRRVIANMLKEETCSETFDALQIRLQSEVNSKKFLLVLDDIWDNNEENDDAEEDKDKWAKVLAPLASGKLGSKILVTTRMESVASIISEVMNEKNEILRLEGLNDDECLQLLLRYAFHCTEENTEVYHNLRSIAEKMIKKLSGSPLATRVMGRILNSRLEETHWTTVLNYHIGSQNGIMHILKLSYTLLPKDLQKCLSFCCTFPQDYELDKDDLIQMWIALDFIQQSNIKEGETLKDVGERYFNFLVRKSLLDKFQEYDRTYYKLHDILHDMLRAISGQECFSIVHDKLPDLRTSKIIRHLFVKIDHPSVPNYLKYFKKLRSLFLLYNVDEDADYFFDMLKIIFKALRSIRLLVIHVSKLKQIPEEIGQLIHLRYLKIIIQKDYPNQLPRFVSNLHHLQFFYCNYLEWLPLGIHEIGKLKSLQQLDGFYVHNKVGYRIKELEHMNELNLLEIKFVENMKYAKDACSAKLCDKKNLRDLSLVWLNNKNIVELEFNDSMMIADENLLENLKPHSSLEKLKIVSFMGARPAIWMKDVNFFSNLEYIKIEHCMRWQTLPPFWQLGVLKYLYLINMPNVKGFDYELYGNDKVRVFPSLQVLHIQCLKALEDWFVVKAAAYDCLFPCLTELYLLNCPNLQKLPVLPPHLEKLEIHNIGWKGCNWLQGIRNYCKISIQNCPDIFSLIGHQEVENTVECQFIISELIINDPSLLLMEPLRCIFSIQKLGILNNDAVISFPPEVQQLFQLLLNIPTSLKHLKLEKLESLQCLPPLLSFSSLKKLKIKNLPELRELPDLPPSLCQLELSNLSNLRCLPSCLPSLSSLQKLHINYLPELRELPNLPRSLCQLKLSDLSNLHYLPSRFPNLYSLQQLNIENLPELRELPYLPPSLCHLGLSDLSNLHCLPPYLRSLSSLQQLNIENLPELREVPNLPRSLCHLGLSALSNLHCLPSYLPNLSSLNSLMIVDCYKLCELPDLPPSLKSLKLHDCHPKLHERYRRITGSDWHKIAGIPKVDIFP